MDEQIPRNGLIGEGGHRGGGTARGNTKPSCKTNSGLGKDGGIRLPINRVILYSSPYCWAHRDEMHMVNNRVGVHGSRGGGSYCQGIYHFRWKNAILYSCIYKFMDIRGRGYWTENRFFRGVGDY